MGMESVELIMAVEEAFEIEIRDEEAAEVRTVGEMHALVWRKLHPEPAPRCLSSAVFYRTRRALMALYELPRQGIAPATPMERLLPLRGRRQHWQRLGQEIGTPLPSLELPRWASRLFFSLAWALLTACLALFLTRPFSVALLVSLAGVLGALALHRAAAPLAIHLPAACATVGGTVREVVRASYGGHALSGRTWDAERVWETLRGVIVEQLDVAPEEVRPETSFFDDLGVG